MILFEKNEQQKRVKAKKESFLLSRILKGLLHLKQRNYCFSFVPFVNENERDESQTKKNKKLSHEK